MGVLFVSKKRDRQVTCKCSAYKFPHRIGGGRCDGSDWAYSYMTLVGTDCISCNCLRAPGECDVVNGTESIKYCDGAERHLLRQEKYHLPMSEEEFFILKT